MLVVVVWINVVHSKSRGEKRCESSITTLLITESKMDQVAQWSRAICGGEIQNLHVAGSNPALISKNIVYGIRK